MSKGKVIDMEKKRTDNPFRKWIKIGIVILITLLLLFLIFTNIFIVKEGEYKIVRQFGEIKRVISDPGIHIKVPFIQTVTTLPKYQMTLDVEQSEINTKDKKRMIIDNYAIWKIEDPESLIINARTMESAEARMEEFVYSVVRSELGQLNYDEIINDENSSRGSLNDRVTEQVNELLKKDQYGIVVSDVRIKRTDLPAENEQSVYTRMISERESTAQDYLSQGDAEKNKIMAETDREYQEMISKAKADAEVIRSEGEGEAAQIYNEAFSKDPEFYRLFRTLESYKKTINDQTVIILPSNSPYARLLQGYVE
ncbi:protease modulator HflC [Caldifermentibacillus hisashii]|uniref:protease modulator HflC n=1 Tax=Caldifermentibacillus hisashii TaxID=996558 RepID=UPI000BA37A5F|nr:protease modulator HflC [Caldifermentibacillus hisashii]PAC35417.1 protease modulator HflC [Caldifermentibacillus hisashii]